MRRGDQAVEEAKKLMDDYIKEHMKKYQEYLKQGKNEDAYFELGMALHPVMDSTSPTHTGFQVWGSIWDMSGYELIKHRLGENKFSENQIKESVDLINNTMESYKINCYEKN